MSYIKIMVHAVWGTKSREPFLIKTKREIVFSGSCIQKLREYINRQEEHHKKISFAEEYEELLAGYGFRFD